MGLPAGTKVSKELFAQEQVQIVKGEGQPAKLVGRLFIESRLFNLAGELAESARQRQVFVVVAQVVQQLPDGLCALTCRLDYRQCRRWSRGTRFDTFKQQAFKRATMLRALRINLASAIRISRAGLGELHRCGGGGRINRINGKKGWVDERRWRGRGGRSFSSLLWKSLKRQA